MQIQFTKPGVVALTGTLHRIHPTERVSETFTKREFVLIDDSKPSFPKHYKCQFTGDNHPLLDAFQPGDRVQIRAYVEGRLWVSPEGKEMFFTELNATSIRRITE